MRNKTARWHNSERSTSWAKAKHPPPIEKRDGAEHLTRLKDQLVKPWLEEATTLALRDRLLRAAEEAASLAWLTPYPLLVMPVLLEEKAQQARLEWERQKSILLRSRAFLSLAA